MVYHTERLRVECDRARLTFRADTFGPWRMATRAVVPHTMKRLDKRRYVRATKLGLVCRRVDLAKVTVEGWVLDLLLGQVARIERVKGLAVVAHALGPVTTHPITASGDLAILSVQSIVKGRLADNFPRSRDALRLRIDGLVFRR